MLLKLVNNYGIWLAISLVVCLVGYLVGLTYSRALADGFLVSYSWYFNGLLIATTGYGALLFTLRTYKGVFHNLLHNVLDIPESLELDIYKSYDTLANFKNKQKIALPIFIAGSLILFSCGYPLYGFPKFLLWISSSSMYYAGGLFIAYLYHAVGLFKLIEESLTEIRLQKNTQVLELENFNFYLSLLFLSATVALYFAFRGTLTANFTFVPPEPVKFILGFHGASDYAIAKKLLLFPLAIFLPYTLFGGFYIRYVLRKVYLNGIKRELDEIDSLTEPYLTERGFPKSDNEVNRIIRIRTAVLELKDKIIQNNRVLPLVNLRDSPSIVLLIIIIVQFVYQYDKTIRDFVRYILGI